VEDGTDDDEDKNGIPVTNLVVTKPTPNSPNKLGNSPVPLKPPQIGYNSKPSFSIYSDVIIPRNTLRSHVPMWRALQEVGSDPEDSDFGTDASGTNDTLIPKWPLSISVRLVLYRLILTLIKTVSRYFKSLWNKSIDTLIRTLSLVLIQLINYLKNTINTSMFLIGKQLRNRSPAL